MLVRTPGEPDYVRESLQLKNVPPPKVYMVGGLVVLLASNFFVANQRLVHRTTLLHANRILVK